MQPLVSSLSAGDCLVHWLRKNSNGIINRVFLMGFTSSIISSIVPYSCLLFKMCNAKVDCGLLLLMYRVCSWYLCFRSLLVCPMYLCLHVLQVSA
jgi:hypothetical protein